jgi:hypothetical protein
MHHPRHAHTIRSLRITAFLLCLKRLVIAGAVVVFMISFATDDRQLGIAGLGLAGLSVLLALLQWISASGARCSLCMMPVLSRKGCSKHRHAKSLLGSRRLRVALSILLKGSFRCPYCNEPTILRLKGPP